MIGSPPSLPDVALVAGGSDELDAVMTIMTAAFEPRFGEGWTRSQCAGILPMSGVSLILARQSDGRPLGFSLFRTLAGEAELLLLAVAPPHRRNGVGRRLLDEFVGRARAGGAGRVHLEVRDGNPAVAMYRAAGFEQVGRRSQYYKGKDGGRFDAITLARDL